MELWAWTAAVSVVRPERLAWDKKERRRRTPIAVKSYSRGDAGGIFASAVDGGLTPKNPLVHCGNASRVFSWTYVNRLDHEKTYGNASRQITCQSLMPPCGNGMMKMELDFGSLWLETGVG